MKRALNDSDSEDSEILDVDDSGAFFSEEGEVSARKKRRGMIEKRRRDRINSCLAELKLLVPAAVEKQGSAKLEKAEILQLTVAYLRKLKQDTGTAGVLSADSAAQYRAAGFQQCMAEVTRYLTASESSESLSSNSLLKSQLLQHINWYAKQTPTSTPSVQTSTSTTNQVQNAGLPVHSTKDSLTPDCLQNPQEVINHNDTSDSGKRQDETELDCSYSQGVVCLPGLNVPPRLPMLTLNPPNLFPVARGEMCVPLPLPGQVAELPLTMLATSPTNAATTLFPPWMARMFSNTFPSIAF